MLTSKQRAQLRAMANSIEPTVWVGKEGITPAVKSSINDAFNTKELVKIALLESCPNAPLEISNDACQWCGCEGVQIIGRRVVLYKPQEKKPAPKDKKPRNMGRTDSRDQAGYGCSSKGYTRRKRV